MSTTSICVGGGLGGAGLRRRAGGERRARARARARDALPRPGARRVPRVLGRRGGARARPRGRARRGGRARDAISRPVHRRRCAATAATSPTRAPPLARRAAVAPGVAGGGARSSRGSRGRGPARRDGDRGGSRQAAAVRFRSERRAARARPRASSSAPTAATRSCAAGWASARHRDAGAAVSRRRPARRLRRPGRHERLLLEPRGRRGVTALSRRGSGVLRAYMAFRSDTGVRRFSGKERHPRLRARLPRGRRAAEAWLARVAGRPARSPPSKAPTRASTSRSARAWRWSATPPRAATRSGAAGCHSRFRDVRVLRDALLASTDWDAALARLRRRARPLLRAPAHRRGLDDDAASSTSARTRDARRAAPLRRRSRRPEPAASTSSAAGPDQRSRRARAAPLLRRGLSGAERRADARGDARARAAHRGARARDRGRAPAAARPGRRAPRGGLLPHARAAQSRRARGRVSARRSTCWPGSRPPTARPAGR